MLVVDTSGPGPTSSVPGMGTSFKVRVLMRVDHNDQSKAQGRVGDHGSEGSVERNPWADEQEPNMRQIQRGASGLGTTKLQWSKQGNVDSAAMRRRLVFLPGEASLLCLKGRRRETVRGVSRGHSSERREANMKGRTIGRDGCP